MSAPWRSSRLIFRTRFQCLSAFWAQLLFWVGLWASSGWVTFSAAQAQPQAQPEVQADDAGVAPIYNPSEKSTAEPDAESRPVLVGAGAWFQDFGGRVSGSESGGSKLSGEIYPHLFVAGRLPIGEGGWFARPEARLSFPGRSDPDQSATRMLYGFSFSVEKKLRKLAPRLGVGVFLFHQGGNGGQIALGNGTSTSSFFRPSGSSTASEEFFSLGVGADIDPVHLKGIRWDADTWLVSPFSSRHAVHVILGVSYGFGV